MSVTTVYAGHDADRADRIAEGIESRGGRAVAAHWHGEHHVFSFKGMTEDEITAWLDAEWERLDAARSAGARS